MNKTDLRILKTKENIRNAFLALMKEKTYSNITVKDIADKALINRKTFYFHYATKDDLYNEISDEISEIIKPDEIIENIVGSEFENQKKIIAHFFNKLKKNKDICSVFLSDESNPEFSNKIKKKLSDALLSKTEIEQRTKGTPYSFEFLSDAYYEIFKLVVRWWLNTDYTDTNLPIDLLFNFFSKEPLEILGIKYE